MAGRVGAVSWPEPTRKAHDAFCTTGGFAWSETCAGEPARIASPTNLIFLIVRILRTRISNPPDRSTYGPGMWKHILRDQLQVDEPDFWLVLGTGSSPIAGYRSLRLPRCLPNSRTLLITRVGMTEAEVAAMGKDEAIDRLNKYWTDRS